MRQIIIQISLRFNLNRHAKTERLLHLRLAMTARRYTTLRAFLFVVYTFSMKEDIKQTIIANTENFDGLERLYRANKDDFRSAIKELHEENAADTTAAIWYSRLFYKEQKEKPKNVDLLKDIGIMVLLAFIAWLPIRYWINHDSDFVRMICFTVFSFMISMYFFLKRGFPIKALAVSGAFHICAFFYLWFLCKKSFDSSQSDPVINFV